MVYRPSAENSLPSARRAYRSLGIVLVVVAAPSCGAEQPGATGLGGSAPSTDVASSPPTVTVAPVTPSAAPASTSSVSPVASTPPVPTASNWTSAASAPDPSETIWEPSEVAGTGETSTEEPTSSDTNAASSHAVSSDGQAELDTSDRPANTGACQYPDPPENVTAWIDESWASQLGDNIRNRSAWLLDNVIEGEGKLNVCVRWGATTAPSAAVKSGVAPALQRWMNDWFQALGTYGCFPYPDGIDVAVTGWAVRPGNEAWVSDLGDEVAIYTEVDAEGEPKCPDVCSFFVNWDHEFPNCPGGEAFHSDYWVWVSDALPGGGAAAVGGDWGLRMPVASFEDRIDSEADLVIEHEIGHGFGFQDYYDWTGSTPSGGSLMIVGSTSMQSPTVGDTWLIRRTWREMQTIRGW